MTVKEILAALPEDVRADAQTTLEGLDPLSGVQDADSAVEFIKSNERLRRGFDKIAQQAVDAHKQRFESERLPELQKQLREEIRRELQPEETPEQKRLRELEEQLSERDKRERLYQTREKLRTKAKELSFDEELAERFAHMQTDDPEAELTKFAERMQAHVKTLADKEVNERWGTRAPKSGQPSSGKIERVEDVPGDWSREQIVAAMESGTISWGD